MGSLKEKGKMNSIKLSVVIPCYNEESRITATLEKVVVYLKESNFSSEIIVVDDGSSDNTKEVLEECCKAHNEIDIISNKQNHGKGFAVRQGILNARGEYILFADADLSTPIEELTKFLYWLENGYEIAIASRNIKNADVKIISPLSRTIMGKIFNFFVRILVLPDFYDTQCGFKCFKRDAALDIFKKQKNDKFSFDVEVLYLAKILGYKIKEVPVNWHYASSSKIRIFRDSIKMFFDVLEIKRRIETEHKGKYNNSNL